MMKTRKELDAAAQSFARERGLIIHHAAGIYKGEALYFFSEIGMTHGGCYGPPQYILVDLKTGAARLQTGDEVIRYTMNEVTRNIKPMPER